MGVGRARTLVLRCFLSGLFVTTTMNDSKESDKQRFVHAGLQCKIVRVDLGHWCGYVRTPDGLAPVRWTSDYDSKYDEVLDAEVDVWGGITYGPDDEGWVGFDDNHARSLVEHRDEEADWLAVKAETKELAEQIRSLHTETEQ